MMFYILKLAYALEILIHNNNIKDKKIKSTKNEKKRLI